MKIINITKLTQLPEEHIIAGDMAEPFYRWFLAHQPKTISTYLPILWGRLHAWNQKGNESYMNQTEQIIKDLPKDEQYFTIVCEGPAAGLGRLVRMIPNSTVYIACCNGDTNRAEWVDRVIQHGKMEIPPPNQDQISRAFPLLGHSPESLWKDVEKSMLNNPKTMFASFYGDLETHWCRKRMAEVLYRDQLKYSIHNIAGETRLRQDIYFDSMSCSVFSLSPRGTGSTSNRQWEAMLCGSIPVYISDQFWLPNYPDVDWDELIVRVHTSEIDNLDCILSSISLKRINEMTENGRIFCKKYLTFGAIFRNIILDLNSNPIRT